MKIEQIYTNCLAQASYYIESEGEVAIIDPLREVDQYLNMANSSQAKIKYIFETHFHADYVSGHVSLANDTGAEIVFGPNAKTNFKSTVASDNQIFQLGNIKIKVLHTPGHTMESSTFLLIDEQDNEHAIFTGDTLFLGDVGRPDLAQKKGTLTTEDLAGHLFDSLRNKIMPLSDDVVVYPGHGAGSACGKNMMNITVDTLGNQKKYNYALDEQLTKDEFIIKLIKDLPAPPAYFPANVALNKDGYEKTSSVIEKGLNPISAEAFKKYAQDKNLIILDIRDKSLFAEAHIPDSIFIGLRGDFAPWVGALLKDINQEILLVAEDEQLEEAITRLARIGFDNVKGYLEGGISSWLKEGFPVEKIESINPIEARHDLAEKNDIIDVRKKNEYLSQYMIGAKNIPLSSLEEQIDELENIEKPIYVHCAGGYRSIIAISILKKHGIENAININGGFKSIKESTLALSEEVCPSTLA